MKKMLLLLSVIILIISWYGCQYKKDAVAYPASTCDTSNVHYSVEIKAILQTNCLVCHGATVYNSLGGGYNYDTYSGIIPNVMNGRLLNDIMQVPGSDPMPKGAPKLSDCDIAKVRTWIRNGYPNN